MSQFCLAIFLQACVSCNSEVEKVTIVR